MNSYQTAIPDDSLTRRFMPADYDDAFACEVCGIGNLSADDLLLSLWTTMPAWVQTLFVIRNAVVRLVGLKSAGLNERNALLEKTIREGKTMDMVSVAAKSDHETVLKLSDKHLDAWMSVHVTRSDDTQIVTAITLVHYRRRLGKVYFFFVRPIHKPLVKSMLNASLKKIQHSQSGAIRMHNSLLFSRTETFAKPWAHHTKGRNFSTSGRKNFRSLFFCFEEQIWVASTLHHDHCDG